MKGKKFATAINCMDGRTQLPVIQWMKKKFKVDFVDTITEPGPVKILAEKKDKNILDSIKRRLEISVKKHNSKIVAIVAHFDCAGNPVEKETQMNQLKEAKKTLISWGMKIKIILLWVDEKWKVNEVK